VVALLRKGELAAFREALGTENSTIGVVATNAALSKMEATKVAQMAHDGLARAIQPVHLPSDGDTIFALATGKWKRRAAALPAGPALHGMVGALAAEAVAAAVVSAILHAKGIPGYPAYSELRMA